MEKELKEMFKLVFELSEKEIDQVSIFVDNIINNQIKNEKTISEVFDLILSIVFIEENKKRIIFYKLLNYCQTFNKQLAADYNKIFEDSLSDKESDSFKKLEKTYN